MNDQEEIFFKLQNNAFTFFRDFIDRITDLDNEHVKHISLELTMLSIISLQTSIELGLKALIIKKRGLESIVSGKKNKNNLYADFENNKLRIKGYNEIINICRKNKIIRDFDENHYKIIEKFKDYRNGIIHSTYNFNEHEYINIKKDIIYFSTNILIRILSEGALKPSEFLRYRLGKSYYNKLINYKPYIKAMRIMAEQNSSKVYSCFICPHITYSKDEDYCYVCNFIGETEHFRDCEFCKEKQTMIYDGLNLHLNDYETKAYCINCKNDTYIFQCPECETTFNLEYFNDKEICSLTNCISN